MNRDVIDAERWKMKQHRLIEAVKEVEVKKTRQDCEH